MSDITPKTISKSYFTKNIISGLLIALPLVIVIFLITWIIKLIANLLQPVSVVLDNTVVNSPIWLINIISFVILLAIFFGLGVFISTYNGKKLFDIFEDKFLSTLPLYTTVNNIVKQFRGVGEKPFEKVVLCDPYGTGALMTAFIVEYINERMVVVYVPTAPNPTNGFVFHIQKDKLIEIKATTEKAMGTVIGMGAGSKDLFKDIEYSKFESISPSNLQE